MSCGGKPGTEGRNECLYVGESTTCVRRRLLQHHSNAQNDGLHSQLRMFRSIVQFSVEFTEDAEETLFLETELIREWKPKTNLKMNPDKILTHLFPIVPLPPQRIFARESS